MVDNNQKEQIMTEVTSVAKEVERTGENIQTLSSDDLANRAASSFISNRKKFNTLFTNLSSRGKTRVMNSVLDLPTDGIPVLLKDETEKLAFAVGQRMIADRFILTQYHINEEIKAAREKKASENEEMSTDTNK